MNEIVFHFFVINFVKKQKTKKLKGKLIEKNTKVAKSTKSKNIKSKKSKL